MCYEFGGLIFRGAYTRRGLFSEFYGMVSLSLSPRFINARLSSPSLAMFRPFRDFYCFLKLNFHVRIVIACVASVSVWFRTMKERPRNDEKREFRFWPRKKWNES